MGKQFFFISVLKRVEKKHFLAEKKKLNNLAEVFIGEAKMVGL